MSDALYLGMMGGITPYSSRDKKRARRQKILSRVAKGLVYAGGILAAAYGAENFMANIGVAGAVCAALECFRA